MAFVSYGQSIEVEKHLNFMGIEIDGRLENFIEKLECKDFTLQTKLKTEAVFVGKFTGKSAKLFIYSTPKTRTVYRVIVAFDNFDNATWSLLESQYLDTKHLLIKKYGEPISVNEEFFNDYVDGDRQKLYELQMGRCEYRSSFVDYKSGGLILVAMLSMDSSTGPCVSVAYSDKINMELYDAECQEDI